MSGAVYAESARKGTLAPAAGRESGRPPCRASGPCERREEAPAASGFGLSLASIPVHAAPPDHSGLPAKPFQISRPDDLAEQEADRAADRVMRGEHVRIAAAPHPVLARKCEACDEDDRPPAALHRKAKGQAAQGGLIAAAALRAPGRPLDPVIRAAFEPCFGTNFADVRVHTDDDAADAARAIDARAFTLGRRIAFGAAEYSPETPAGRHLIAHELAHVAQGGPAEIVHRFPYETKGISLLRQSVVNLTGGSYWLQRTTERYALTWDHRLANDPEERDAALAALWAQNPPDAVPAASELIVPVQARPAVGSAAAPPALLYRFRFLPPLAAGDKPRLSAEFIASGPGSIPISASAPAPGFKPGKLDGSFRGFTTGVDAYFAAHPQEHAQLANFIAGKAGAIDQVVKTVTMTGSTETHRSLFHVARAAGVPAQAALSVTLASESAPTAAVAPQADYRTLDLADLLLEKQRSTSLPQADRLGVVNLPAGLPADERLAVNLAVLAYFETGKARDTEVDAMVPVGTGTRVVLYTLRFGAANDVSVERIGEAGTAAGQVNMSRADVTRVSGFPGASAPDATLRSWWAKRYPAGGALQTPLPPKPAPAPAGVTPPAPAAAAAQPAAAGNTTLLDEMNSLIAAGSGTTAWFQGNYGISVMNAAGTASRLKGAHAVPAALLTDTKDFPATELATLEIAFQTLSKAELARLRTVRVGRKAAGLTRTGNVWGPADFAGLTITTTTGKTSTRTILYFDKMHLNNDALFKGSTASNALPDIAMTILHEAGHALEHSAGIEAAFDAWLKKNPQAAPTWYAASNPGGELFPEAYSLFHTDPRFLCGSASLMYAWFVELSLKGTAPSPSAKLTPPAACPA